MVSCPIRSLQNLGSAPLCFPQKITRLFLSSGVFIRCDLATVVKLAHDGIGSLLWVIEGEGGCASREVHECDLKSSDQ
jgi:hypothetical protein